MVFAATTGSRADETPAAVPETVMEEGAVFYRRHCRYCHGSKGASAGTPLRGLELLEDPEYMPRVILQFPVHPPAWPEMFSDEDIALITTYLNNAWGNDYGVAKAEDAARVRKELDL